MTNSGNTIPKTYASPSTAPPATDPERADSVITPARTGAQQLEATPEKTPSAKKLAVSPRAVSGARRKLGSDHIRPDSDSPARTSISRPPVTYSGAWYFAIAPATRLTPTVIGTSTRARPAVKTNVNGSSRHRRFFTAPAR